MQISIDITKLVCYDYIKLKDKQNKKLNPKANTYDDIGYSIRIHKKPDSYQLPDFKGYNQRDCNSYLTNIEYTTFL